MTTETLDERLRLVETAQAVNSEVMKRIESDLRDIATSSNAIREVVTRWRGGLGVLLLVAGAAMTVVSVLVEVIMRKVWP